MLFIPTRTEQKQEIFPPIPKKLGFFRNTPIFKESENSTEDASRAPYTENPNNYDKYVKTY